MRRLAPFAVLCLLSSVICAELTEKTQKRLDSAEANYKQAVEKADNARFYAIQKANAERLKALKFALTEATKLGDFEAATKFKELIEAAESGSVRAKPKNVVKFAGHEYAAIDDRLSFHNAKTRCEEMGGRLVTFQTPQEQEFVLALCRRQEPRFGAWIGASNEAKQEDWMWLSGERIGPIAANWKHDNPNYVLNGHAMTYWPDSDGFNDDNFGSRMGYVCEWEK